MRTLRTIFTVVSVFFLTLALLVFAYQNADLISIKFLKWETRYPTFFVLLLAALGGTLLTSFVGLIELIRVQSRLRKSQRAREMLEREIDALRNQPLFEEPAQPERTQPLPTDRTLIPSEDEAVDIPHPLRRERIG